MDAKKSVNWEYWEKKAIALVNEIRAKNDEREKYAVALWVLQIIADEIKMKREEK